jgi:GGDEF domain-containing protein
MAPFCAFCHVAEIIWNQSNLLRTLSQKAQLDAVTGLMNRRQTMYVLEKAIAQSLQDYFLTGPINIKNSSIRLSVIVGVASFSQECSGLDQLVQRANQSMLNAAPSALL